MFTSHKLLAMENMITKWCTKVKSVPKDYVFPEGIRPREQVVPIGKNFQVIDLENKAVFGNQKDVVQQIIQASQDSGFFQVPFFRLLCSIFNINIYVHA